MGVHVGFFGIVTVIRADYRNTRLLMDLQKA